MPTDDTSELAAVAATGGEPRRVLVLVSNDGDRRVLTDWLRRSEAYTVVPGDSDPATVPFDCCIVDVATLLDGGAVLSDRVTDATGLLPVLLLVPESRVETVQDHLRSDHPQRWAIVDGVVQTPLTQVAFETQLDMLCRLQEQAEALEREHDRLQRRGEQLALLNRMLRHDIRNDMDVVLGWLEALDDSVDAEGEPVLDHIRRAGNHVVELTTVAREFVDTIESGDDPELEPVVLSEVLSEEVARRRRTFEEATIEIEGRLPAVTVEANELLASVFRNLINNAVQHNDTDHPTVTVAAEERGRTVVVRVADDGPGVDDQHKERLFGADTKGLESDGTGMGLYLVERLVDIYGGEVGVEDNAPRGAVFVVELPTTDSPAPEAT